jgi:hypothetical protein
LRETLGLLCSCFDDPRGIMRMFEQPTIEDFDYLYFFDGKYSQWEGKAEFPVNETRDIVKDFGDTHNISVYYELVEGKTEAMKRNHMFQVALDLGTDWALIIDSDEIPYINKHEWNIERTNLGKSKYGCFGVESVGLDGVLRRLPRLFNMREEPYLIQNESTLSHNHIYSALDGRDLPVDITEKPEYTVTSITTLHDKMFHTDQRFKDRFRYGAINNH